MKIKEISQILNGYAFKSSNYISNGYRVIRITNVQSGYLEDEKPVYYEYDNKLSKYELMENDILISLTGNVGRCALVSSDFLPAYLNQRVCCLRVDKKKVLPKFLYYILNSKKFEFDCVNSSQGIAQLNMSTEWLKEYNLEIPSIEKQKEIIKIFDKVYKKIDIRKVQIEYCNNLIKSQFVEMFGDLSLNNKEWNIYNFSDVAKIDTKMTKDFEKYCDYPHIGIENIEKNTGKLVNYKTVKESKLTSGKYIFDERHIIYSKIRPNLNKVASPTFSGLCSADSYPILVNEMCNKKYLTLVLRSDFFLNYILSYSSRTNIPKVNKEQLCGFKLPVPPIELQNKFAQIVEQIDKQKFEFEKSLKKLEELQASLMQEYFG